MTRSSTIDVQQMDHVRVATLRGLPPRVELIAHVLRNSLLPTITGVANLVADIVYATERVSA